MPRCCEHVVQQQIVAPYLHDIIFYYIAVGNDRDKGYVTTVTTCSCAINGPRIFDPPSSGAFTQEASSVMRDILKLVVGINPFTPYDQCVSFLCLQVGPCPFPLDYAQFASEKPVVRDGNFNYFYLFDAIVDAFLAAMDKAGNGHVRVAFETLIFAMLNENQKPNGEEQHFGLFPPNMKPVYYVPFS
ncbi:hypothetical protein M0R45_003663 [Rubus argutus]|uniref:glucan endo-1,3-beta-D-glucosidase n=1 Tax=Rubus argutus TaxID=59490 RepID=A0AAW1YI41_RUBAR